MHKLETITAKVANKNNFLNIQNYIDFALILLEYIETNKQATIISQNESNYNFFQFPKEGNYKVTRPFNSKLLLSSDQFDKGYCQFIDLLKQIKELKGQAKIVDKNLINKTIYTIQQSIGFALDAFSGNGDRQSNAARKLNGDLFERLIKFIIQDIGVKCRSGIVNVPIAMENQELFNMSYQHDLIIEDGEILRVIGSVKTTSKDRIDKIFIDKFLYSKLTETTIPHIAIFLHDVQRKKTHEENKFGVSATFLPGHFKGYTIKLNPLDGVYYLDPRPNMLSDIFLSKYIQTFDHLICEDIWKYID